MNDAARRCLDPLTLATGRRREWTGPLGLETEYYHDHFIIVRVSQRGNGPAR